MEDLLRALDYAEPFVEDVMVSSRTPHMSDDELKDAHFNDVCKVLEILGKHRLTCSGAKAVLFAIEVEFAGQARGNEVR